MPRLNEGFAASIPELLVQVGPHRSSRVVPDKGRRVKTDLPVAVEHAPAEVDVIARDHVDRVETPELLHSRAPEGHVAARHVLGSVIR